MVISVARPVKRTRADLILSCLLASGPQSMTAK